MPEIIEQMDVQTNKVDDNESSRCKPAVMGGALQCGAATWTPSSPSARKEASSDATPISTTPEKRLGLITAMGQFRPKSATPIQFYNFVREFCIMHNCSIDEAMERAPIAWSTLSKAQTQLYNSVSYMFLNNRTSGTICSFSFETQSSLIYGGKPAFEQQIDLYS